MLLGKRFTDFIKQSPISVMMQGIIEYAFNDQRLDAIFEQTAQSQYTRTLIFQLLPA